MKLFIFPIEWSIVRAVKKNERKIRKLKEKPKRLCEVCKH